MTTARKATAANGKRHATQQSVNSAVNFYEIRQ